ncbi:hypothetical protein GLAREA_05876 [Glarea lozoyensis ATCC 20868]|uniref:Heterokaryon incompatibility domain-containing protein n=1 Tax=Glarea lozoyensis (strain ATCC 20868 / MF5171) TaxID=1116229 RepID=S3D6W8_GLAL2|nr:uncharacterized protein GLAREA_05876 [Glarea lozoyensis ATCC 20868]EPE32864.1 hypothetical protein GLAREA_05876 [Glarea lozoyensis ATCC 20868]
MPESPGIIRLRNQRRIEQSDPYAALSHCWGDPAQKPLTTTIENERSHETGISVEVLPQSFKDAVAVARFLNIRYLWIDSLCILQDSESDWATESRQMADIYKNAKVTIAAACAENSHAGFLRTRPSQGKCYKLAFTKPDGGREIWLEATTDNEENPVPETSVLGRHPYEPLQKRAWVLQEQLLSSKVIYFDSDQVLWECNSVQYAESRTFPYNGQFNRYDRRLSRNFHLNNPQQKGGDTNNSTSSIYLDWYALLREFRRRELTYESDSLPAMSGLAREFASITKDEYLGGLWKSDLFRGLGWGYAKKSTIVTRGVRSRSASSPLSQDLALSLSPASWTWASIPSGSQEFLGGPFFFSISETWENADTFLPNSISQRLISSETVPRYLDTMGQLNSARLVLEGACRSVNVRLHDNARLENHPYGTIPKSVVFEIDGMKKHYNQYIYASIDRLFQLRKEIKLASDQGRIFSLTCFLLGRTDFMHMHGLLLYERVLENAPVYYRCGMLHITIRDKSFYQGWSQKTLTLL